MTIKIKKSTLLTMVLLAGSLSGIGLTNIFRKNKKRRNSFGASFRQLLSSRKKKKIYPQDRNQLKLMRTKKFRIASLNDNSLSKKGAFNYGPVLQEIEIEK